MYLDNFGLAVNPFGLSPKLDFLYKSAAFEESMAHLIYGLDNSEAVVLITGAIGTGKTMALQSFLSHLGSQFSIALITNTRVNSLELLKLILEDLGVSFPSGVDKSDLLILFKDFLIQASREGRQVLVAVDEAQNLSRDVLEEVRLLTNLGQGDSQPVQIILLGQPELETILDRDDLAQLRQRIRVHYRLETLSRDELVGYLNVRMSVAGGEDGVFTSGAVDRIFRFSNGVPRVVNTLAGEALLSAFVAGHKRVESSDVEEPQGLASTVGPVHEDVSGRVRPAGEAVPVSDPVEPLQSRPAPQAEPVMATRASSQRRDGKRWWWIPAIVGLGLVIAYSQGYLDFMHLKPDSPAGGASPMATQGVKNTALVAATVERVAPAGAAQAQVVVDSTTAAPAELAHEPAAAQVPAVAPPGPPVGRFYLHVSSFRSRDHAEQSAASLVANGMHAVTGLAEVKGTPWYRVYIGPFQTHEDARLEANSLAEAGWVSYYKIVELEAPSGS